MRLVDAGETVTVAADRCNVQRSTIYRALAKRAEKLAEASKAATAAANQVEPSDDHIA